jgi:membrane carboxypeptidase/penicillin-binding protein
MFSGHASQGASTITQQLARNFFLSPERTLIRKIKEVFLAIRIEQLLSKDEILELYLNKIYLGYRAYGVGAAAQVYFGKSMDQLDAERNGDDRGSAQSAFHIQPALLPGIAPPRAVMWCWRGCSA